MGPATHRLDSTPESAKRHSPIAPTKHPSVHGTIFVLDVHAATIPLVQIYFSGIQVEYAGTKPRCMQAGQRG